MLRERILIVEDEEDIIDLVRYNLEKEGYQVTGVTSGEKALQVIKEKTPDLVLLDLMLPGMDGIEVCRKIKAEPKIAHLPVIMLTAKSEEADIVAGLELGAEDYVTKPFSPKVLISRIRNVLRRQKAKNNIDECSIVKIHDLVLHPGRYEVHIKGKPIVLSRTEFKILHLLARNPGWVYSRDRIVDEVHGQDYPVTQRAVDVQIVGLRKKLGTSGKYIETVRGVGYKLKE